MRCTDLALANLRVRKAKALFMILGIVLGIGTVTALTSLSRATEGALTAQKAAMVERIVIAPKAHRVSLTYRGLTVASQVTSPEVELTSGLLERLRTEVGPSSLVLPKLVVPTQVDGKPVLVVGTDWQKEIALRPYLEVEGEAGLQEGSALEGKEVILGYLAAAHLGARRGDELSLAGNRYRVAGVLAETGAEEDRVVFVDLAEAQKAFGKPDRLTLVELGVAYDRKEALAARLKELFPDLAVTAPKTQAEERRAVADRFIRFAGLVSPVIFVVGALIVFCTQIAAVKERTREIGVFRAVGFRRRHIAQVILVEASLVSLIGGVAGYGLGVAGAALAGSYFLGLGPAIPWSLWNFVATLALALAVGLAASLYPAWQATRLDPLEALWRL